MNDIHLKINTTELYQLNTDLGSASQELVDVNQKLNEGLSLLESAILTREVQSIISEISKQSFMKTSRISFSLNNLQRILLEQITDHEDLAVSATKQLREALDFIQANFSPKQEG